MRLLLLFIIVLIMACKSEPKLAVQQEIDKPIIDKPSIEAEKIDSSVDIANKKKLKELKPGWVEIIADDFTVVDLRYATENNFVEEQMYDCGRCYIREEAYKSLQEIRSELKDKGYGIILYDCYRPRPIQQKLWDKVPNASYVTPPSRGSMHNRGVALDLGLINADKEILDMGTEFDYFGREGHHDYYDHSEQVLNNRKSLKSTMENHNFASIRTEWWHYSYVVGEYEIADWRWDCQ